MQSPIWSSLTPLRDGGDDRRAHAGALQVGERALLDRLLIAGAAQHAQLRVAQRVELQVDVDLAPRQLLGRTS